MLIITSKPLHLLPITALIDIEALRCDQPEKVIRAAFVTVLNGGTSRSELHRKLYQRAFEWLT